MAFCDKFEDNLAALFDSPEFDIIGGNDNKRTRRAPVVVDLQLSQGHHPRRLLADDIWGKDYRKEYFHFNFDESKEYSALDFFNLYKVLNFDKDVQKLADRVFNIADKLGVTAKFGDTFDREGYSA
jgi:hypothetical protein